MILAVVNMPVSLAGFSLLTVIVIAFFYVTCWNKGPP